MFFCQYCKTKYDDLKHLDYSDEGFFCDVCDNFTYFKTTKKQHRFQLFLEENSKNTMATENRAHLQKNLSPLRYPGGKSKLLPLLYQNLNKENLKTFVEPFAGGASFGLALLEANIIENYILNDKDYGIYALFKTIKERPEILIKRIESISPTHSDFYKARKAIQKSYPDCELIEAAWDFLIVNRLAYSGIVKANPLGGKNGGQEQLLSRWNPAKLINKIKTIHSLSNRITITNKDALDVIEDYYWTPNTTIFIDPPYYKKGKQLYTHYYNPDEHINLKNLLFSLSAGCPGADILLTYDNEPATQELYWWAHTHNIKLHYSI